MDTIHTDHLPAQTLEQTRGDFRQMGWAFIETKWCDVKDNRICGPLRLRSSARA